MIFSENRYPLFGIMPSRREQPMCLLCDDEKSYQLYMDYLDEMERQGKVKDVDAAMDAILDKVQAAQEAEDKLRRGSLQEDLPENDRTLSPFFCSPVNK